MLTQSSTSFLKNFGRASDESFSRDETQRVISYEVSFHKYLTIFHGRNKMSVIQKALVQLNLNLTVPKSSRSHFSFVQKHFGIILTDTFWVVCVSICCCGWSTLSRRLGPHTEHLRFSCMRGGGILEWCHEATDLKPLSLVQFFDFWS